MIQQKQTYLLPPTPTKKKNIRKFIMFYRNNKQKKRAEKNLTRVPPYPTRTGKFSLVFFEASNRRFFEKNQATWCASCKLEFQVHHVHPTHESHGDPPSALKFFSPFQ